MKRKFLQNHSLIFNQNRVKLLRNHSYDNTHIDTLRMSVEHRKLKAFSDDIVLESLFLLEFLNKLKSNVTHYKKTYQEVSLQVLTLSRKSNIFYFLTLLKIFYFPILFRRDVHLSESHDISFNYAFTITNINSFLFLPDIFFKWNNPINCYFILRSKSHKESLVYLHQWNFPVQD